MGHTFPGACAPFGIVQLSPDTDTVPHNINGVYQPLQAETKGLTFETIVGQTKKNGTTNLAVSK